MGYIQKALKKGYSEHLGLHVVLTTSLAGRPKSLVQPIHSNLHAPTRNTKFCPLLRPLLLQPSFGIVKSTPAKLPNMNWGKLKKYVPSHKQGDVCPNGAPALVEGANIDDDSE